MCTLTWAITIRERKNTYKEPGWNESIECVIEFEYANIIPWLVMNLFILTAVQDVLQVWQYSIVKLCQLTPAKTC
jgi:hypothetical protein